MSNKILGPEEFTAILWDIALKNANFAPVTHSHEALRAQNTELKAMLSVMTHNYVSLLRGHVEEFDMPISDAEKALIERAKALAEV